MNSVFVLCCCAIVTLIEASPVQDFASGNKIFTADIYKEEKKLNSGNFLVSPFSAQVVLALTQSGAKDATAEEIRSSLHLPNTDAKTRSSLEATLSSLEARSDFFSLYSANKIYVKKNLPLKDDFKSLATGVYKSEVESIDFARKDEAASAINQWVEKQTANKIRDLVKSADLGDDTAVILINSLYLKAKWLHDFDASQTAKRKFYRNSNDAVEVDTMVQRSKLYKYFHSDTLKATFLEILLQGEEASFVIVLPEDKDGLATLEQKQEVFQDQNYQQQTVDLSFPKFKTETKVDFKEILQNLGVRKIFGQEADLSGIAGKKGDLSVAKVVQKTFIDVNEEGIEAAAATEVVASFGSSFNPAKPKEIVVDRPFIYYIKVKGVILFAGRVVDPSQ